MTLDPRISIWLNVATAALVPIGAYLASNTTFMQSQAGLITVVTIGAVVAGANGILHAIPSKAGAADQFPLGPKT
jgi:hypothetical protein